LIAGHLQGGREALSAKVLKYHAARQKHHLTLWNKRVIAVRLIIEFDAPGSEWS
jgi:hypothetical protein